MNEFDKELVNLFGKKKFKKVKSAKIGIAGCGGLGSNCASLLVRSGFRCLKLVDFDEVESSNLNRQFFFYSQKGEKKAVALKKNLEKINPDINIEILISKVEKNNIKEIFSDYTIIVEAFDRAEDKSMLISELRREKELIVSASGLSGIGSSDNIVTRRIGEDLIVVGDFVTDAESIPPFAPRVSIAAAKQVDVILEHVLSM